MIRLLLTAFGLGLASLDVTAAVLAAGALGAGARVRALLAFGCISILGTVAFGTALSLIVGPRISDIDWGMLLPHTPTEDRVAALVEVILGVGLLIWGIVRLRRPGARPPKPGAPRGLGLVSLAATGALFALAAIIDPAFVSLVVIAGRADLFWSVARRPRDVDVGKSRPPDPGARLRAERRERAGRDLGPNLVAEDKPVDGSCGHGRPLARGDALLTRCSLVLRDGRPLLAVVTHRCTWSARPTSGTNATRLEDAPVRTPPLWYNAEG